MHTTLTPIVKIINLHKLAYRDNYDAMTISTVSMCSATISRNNFPPMNTNKDSDKHNLRKKQSVKNELHIK